MNLILRIGAKTRLPNAMSGLGPSSKSYCFPRKGKLIPKVYLYQPTTLSERNVVNRIDFRFSATVFDKFMDYVYGRTVYIDGFYSDGE